MSETDFVPTRGSSLKRKAEENFQIVVFESHKSKQKAQNSGETEVKQTSSSGKAAGVDIKKAKHEVVRFAMSGLEGEEKEEAKVRLAIKLGAKPRKNKYKNYKELKAERSKQNMEKEKQAKLLELGKNSAGKSNAKGKSYDRKRRKEKGGLLNMYGRVVKPEATKVQLTKRK